MDLKNLKRFLIAAETGNFRRAAQLLHMTQPALTQSIKRLEDELGVTLFERGYRGVTLTAFGVRLVPRAKLVLAEHERIAEDFEEVRSGKDVKLHVGVGPYFSRNILPKAVLRTLGVRPGLKIEVQEGHTLELLRLLEEGQLDVAFCVTNELVEGREGIAFERTYDELYSVMARHDHPLCSRTPAKATEEDLTRYPWVVIDPGSTSGKLGAFFRKHRLEPPAWSINTLSFGVIAALVSQSDHLAMLPRDFARPEIAAGRLRIIKGHGVEVRGRGGLMTRRDAVHSSAALEFMDQVRVTCAELQHPPEN